MTIVSAEALLFDLDGVLVNSIPAVERVWSRWAEERGFNVQEVLHRAHGRPSIETLRYLLPDADHEAENRLVEQAEIEDVEGIIPLPGVKELLAVLPHDRWAIVTSCTRPLAEVRVRAAGLPTPGLFITSNDITHGKPHPEPYLKGAAGLGFAPEQCIVVEDALAGIASGRNAGARVIAFTTTAPIADLVAAKPDWILKDCSAIRLDREPAAAAVGSGMRLTLEEVTVSAR
ncbi:MAG TPA: HAD family hydrolase [Acidobacteriaceae bacterium]|jgi:sugar-phosphatase